MSIFEVVLVNQKLKSKNLKKDKFIFDSKYYLILIHSPTGVGCASAIPFWGQMNGLGWENGEGRGYIIVTGERERGKTSLPICERCA